MAGMTRVGRDSLPVVSQREIKDGAIEPEKHKIGTAQPMSRYDHEQMKLALRYGDQKQR